MADLPRRSASRPSARSLEDDAREAALDARERAADKRDRDPNNAGVSAGPGPRGPVQHGQAGHVRDADASERDTLAEGRDDQAGERDAVAASRDVHAMGVITEQPETPPSALLRTIAQLQTSSTADRRQAGADRRLSARDRADSLADRVASGQDRTLAAAQRESAIHDDLTGTLRREQGLFQLDQEIERAARGAGLLCFAFVDVDGLKVVNDSLSHQAGDEVLRRVCDALRAHLRPYDSIVRYGGDEFVCGLPGLTIKEVQARFAAIEVTLAQGAVSASVTTGLAMCEPGDTVYDLIGRADADLHRQRERRNQRGWRM
jgi:diguanylate cyclase (GGDEF)-like protein